MTTATSDAGTAPACEALTIREFAAAIRVSERTVARLIGDGIITSVKVRARRLIPAAEVGRILNAGRE